MDKHLHIVSLNIPYPADYGGSFEIYHKIVALHRAGIRIHLHCFSKADEGKQPHLNEYCEEVCYYPRKTGLQAFSLTTPYIVRSRANSILEKRLNKDNYPVILEGVHCTSALDRIQQPGRKVILRLHNVEHKYYRGLFESTKSGFKKMYFRWESQLLKKYERKLSPVPDMILAISASDLLEYQNSFKVKNIFFLPAFSGFSQYVAEGLGNYGLYHGNLSVPENERAAEWLLNNVFSHSEHPYIIAGKNPSAHFTELVRRHPNVSMMADPSSAAMDKLIREAQVHILPSYNSTGIKFKLIHALFQGRHCIVNKAAVEGSGMEDLCRIADSADSFLRAIDELFTEPFTGTEAEIRKSALQRMFDDDHNAERLIQWIW